MNKYLKASRTLVLSFQILIFVLFGAFGCYFGFFAVPAYLTADPGLGGIVSTDYAYNLFLELAVIGLSEATIAVYGIIQGVKGFIDSKDDTPVIKGFTTFIVQGYILAAFFFVNAFVFFDLVKGTNLAFVIIMSLILTVALMIATNIPMVRLYDNADQKPLLGGMTFGFAIVGGWIAIMCALTEICSFTTDTLDSYLQMRILLLIAIIAGAGIAVLLGKASSLLFKGGDKNSTNLASYLSSGALGTFGLLFLINGILDLVWQDNKCHFNSGKLAFDYGYAYPIMSIIFGALLFVGAIVLLIMSSDNLKNKIKEYK